MATVAQVLAWQDCILRAENQAQATALANSGLSDAQIQEQLLDQAEISTQPALLVFSLMLGVTQTETNLDSNAAFALNQFNSYTAAGVLDPSIGPYEAMGSALSQEAGFLALVAGQSVPQVINSFYVQASGGISPGGPQVAHFQAQYDYFVSIYTAAGIPLVSAQQQALGAVVGQIIGVWAVQEGGNLDERAESFLLGCIDGTSVFGAPLPQLNDFDLTIGVDNLSTGQAGAVFTADPGANPPLGTTNTLNTGDTLASSVGDATLNYSAVGSLIENPAFAVGVNMNGIATANITNNSLGLAGFAGNITGLTTVNMQGSGPVQVGAPGAGLNTALANIGINSSQDFTAWMTAAALAGAADTVNVNLNGVTTDVDLNVTSGTNAYETVNVVSGGAGPNDLSLNTNGTTTATINVSGAQNLFINGSAMDMSTLALFDASTATGDITAVFNGTGDVTANGGSGNDTFTFPAGNAAGAVVVNGNAGDDTFVFLTNNGGVATFTGNDTADGGAGNDRLRLQVDTGAILLGGTILNIETIQHFANGVVNGALSADMALSGSSNVLDLQADYNGNDVAITNLITTKSVLFSGDDIDDMDLDATSLIGQVNLTMAQTAAGGTQNINDLDVTIGNLLNLTSAGNAATNLIEDVSGVNGNVAISGPHNLLFGFNPALGKAANAGNAYDFPGGIIDATAHTGGLSIGLDTGKQQVSLGTGNDLVHIWTAGVDDNAKLIQLGPLATGGSDIVELHDVFNDASDSITGTNLGAINYTRIEGFNVANDIIRIDAGTGAFEIDIEETNATGVFNPPAIFNYLPGSNQNLAGLFIDMIKVDVAIGAFSTPDSLFDAAIGANAITVNAATNGVLFGVYSNDFQSMTLFVIDGPGATITAADDVDVVAVVGMSFADFQTFGTNGSLVFV